MSGSSHDIRRVDTDGDTKGDCLGKIQSMADVGSGSRMDLLLAGASRFARLGKTSARQAKVHRACSCGCCPVDWPGYRERRI
jgi:hypothetical protein